MSTLPPASVPTGPYASYGPARTDPLAVAGLVSAFLVPPVGLVLGAVARGRIPLGRPGRGLATAASVLGGVLTALWIGVIALAIALGGSFSAGFTTTAVPAASVQEQVVAATGLPATAVSCPDDLPGRVGASTVCSATVDGTTTPLDVSVTSVDGSDVRFHITSR